MIFVHTRKLVNELNDYVTGTRWTSNLSNFPIISDAWFEKMKKMVAANRGIVIHPVNAA